MMSKIEKNLFSVVNSWETAMNNVDATGHSPMRRLIAELPEAALLVMNQCVTYSHQDRYHPDLKVSTLHLICV